MRVGNCCSGNIYLLSMYSFGGASGGEWWGVQAY